MNLLATLALVAVAHAQTVPPPTTAGGQAAADKAAEIHVRGGESALLASEFARSNYVMLGLLVAVTVWTLYRSSKEKEALMRFISEQQQRTTSEAALQRTHEQALQRAWVEDGRNRDDQYRTLLHEQSQTNAEQTAVLRQIQSEIAAQGQALESFSRSLRDTEEILGQILHRESVP